MRYETRKVNKLLEKHRRGRKITKFIKIIENLNRNHDRYLSKQDFSHYAQP